jgi:hypothetical protein
MKFPLNSDGSFRLERGDGVQQRPSRGHFLCALVDCGRKAFGEWLGFCLVFYLNARLGFLWQLFWSRLPLSSSLRPNHFLFHGVRLLRTLLLCAKVPLVEILGVFVLRTLLEKFHALFTLSTAITDCIPQRLPELSKIREFAI